MRKVISIVLGCLVLTGCSLVSNSAKETIHQVGFGLLLASDTKPQQLTMDLENMWTFEFTGNHSTIDIETGFIFEGNTIRVENDAYIHGWNTTVFVRRSAVTPSFYPLVIVQKEDGTREPRKLEETAVGFGDTGGAFIRLFDNVLARDGTGDPVEVTANIRYSDPLEKLEMLVYTDNHELIERMDAKSLSEYTIKTGFIVIEATRVAVDGTRYVERDIYSSHDQRNWKQKTFIYPYFDEDAVIASLGQIQITMEGAR